MRVTDPPTQMKLSNKNDAPACNNIEDAMKTTTSTTITSSVSAERQFIPSLNPTITVVDEQPAATDIDIKKDPIVTLSEQTNPNELTTDEEIVEQHFGTVSPILGSNNMKRNLSSIGTTKVTNFRINFQKSHTCGSLFANCNCSPITVTPQQTATTQFSTHSPTPAKARLLPLSVSPVTSEASTTATIISHSNEKTTGGSDWKSSKHSNSSTTSTHTTTNTSTGLSHDSSCCSSVDLATDGDGNSAESPLQPQSIKSNAVDDINIKADDQRNSLPPIARNNITVVSGNCEKPKTKTKRLFQSYSHPDTDFIFTDENKNPSRSSLAQRQNQPQVVTSRGGRVEIKHPKRSSSPNIGQYQVLDVAVHPDILVKISPKHSPAVEVRRTQSAITSKTTQQRRRLLRRSDDQTIESENSTSDSEQTSGVRVQPSQTNTVDPQSCLTQFPSPSSSPPERKKEPKEISFDAAQKYFQESGILGPINTSTNLIRKTSKILQDSNVIEQIRKTSMILRATKLSSTSSPKILDDNGMDSPSQSPKTPPRLFQREEFDGITLQLDRRLSNDRSLQIKSLQSEIVSLKNVIKEKDSEVARLRHEVDKLKSVLQQTATNQFSIVKDDRLPSLPATGSKNNNETTTTTTMTVAAACDYWPNYQYVRQLSDTSSVDGERFSPDATASLQYSSNGKSGGNKVEAHSQTTPSAPNTFVTCALVSNNNKDSDIISTAVPVHRLRLKGFQVGAPVLKKQGVSGESCESSIQQSIKNVPIPKFEKDFRSKQLIKDAIMDNDFLKNIDSSQVRELVESMYSLEVANGEYVIREGDVGAHLYVSAVGEFEVMKNGKVLGVMGPGKAFGELAILYNCTRTASVRVLSAARVWVLDRWVFQQIMMRTGLQRIENSVNFLKSVPLLKNLSSDVLAKIADVLEVEFYPAGTYIIRQGTTGDTFFLISQGQVRVTQKVGPSAVEKEIRILEPGDYFGEQALINEDKRTANIIAMPPGVECLTLDRESFTHLIGNLSELKEKSYDDEHHVQLTTCSEKTKEVFGTNITQEFPDMKLSDLEVVSTLGIGGFGRVELVKAYRENTVRIFALKCLKKKHIVDTKQEEHIFSERTIMMTCNSPFICRLYRTFRDDRYVYMLLEACMGGEVWTMLRDRGCFDENATQFLIGCVLQAFEYLHARGIIYRDLKPENLMLDERGYVKLVDFGFSKHIGNGIKTWTFCGTPEYVAPEIILNKGHDRAVDYWALGILIHELLNGTPPFTANDPMQTYNIILKGIDMIDFPKHMSRSAVQLIKKLCRDVPAERLGYQKGGIQDIKKHKWFLGFDWDGLASQMLIPPFVRPIAHPTDTCYFDKFPGDTADAPEENSGWDADF